MKNYVATEVAYKNGYKAALEEETLRQAICKALQKTAFFCSTETHSYCTGTGGCATCGIIARTIREEKGL